jgi:GAF domain-containing protein
VPLEKVKKRAEEQDSLQGVVEILYESVSHYNWVGIYRLEGDELVLAAWKGPQATQHVRIPVGEGICGSAARTGETEVVPEVSSDSRYLACFPSTRSEIVVPIKRGGDVLGEIDIDSDLEDAFQDDDRILLEEVARILAEKWTRTR